jgi:hypothetical protein
MPSGIVATELIASSMRLFGGIASNETPKAADIRDGLVVLNDMLENLSTESLSVWGSSNQTFNTIPGQATYTIGPLGDWDTQRPENIDDAYCTLAGVDFPVHVIDQLAYNSITLKTMQQPLVNRLLYVNEFPLGVVTLWPVPKQEIPITLTMRRLLTFPVQATDVLTGPPGFLKMLRYNHAVEFAPEFGMEPSATVIQVALDAKADFKRANLPEVVATYDGAITSNQVALYQRGY